MWYSHRIVQHGLVIRQSLFLHPTNPPQIYMSPIAHHLELMFLGVVNHEQECRPNFSEFFHTWRYAPRNLLSCIAATARAKQIQKTRAAHRSGAMKARLSYVLP